MLQHPRCLIKGDNNTLWYPRTVALTPLQADFDFTEVKRVCQDCTKLGFEAMYEAGPARPFRFIYLSAEGTPRDPTKDPVILPDFFIMRVIIRCP